MPDRRKLLALTLAGLLVRACFLVLEPETQPIADEQTWVNWATAPGGLLDPRVSLSPFKLRQLVFHPPLYPYFIAIVHAGFGSLGTLTAVKWVQIVVSALLVPAVGRVASAAFGARAGLASAAIAAFYPDLIWFSVHFWSETVFMVLLFWFFERLIAAERGGRARTAAAAGLVCGLSILARETALYFTPFAAVFLAWRRGGDGLRRAALYLLSTALVVAPWTYRNWVAWGAFVPVSTAGGLNLYQGNAPLTREEVYERYDAVRGRIEQYRWARRMGLQAILDRQPFWIFAKLRDEMPSFWEADSLALIHIGRGGYQEEIPVAWARVAWALIALPHLGVLAFFARGLVALSPDRRVGLLVGFLVFYNLLHVVTHGFSRYRLPIMPVVFMLAASGFLAWRSRARLSRPRRFALVALWIVFGLCVLPSLRRNFDDPAFGFVRTPPAAAPSP